MKLVRDLTAIAKDNGRQNCQIEKSYYNLKKWYEVWSVKIFILIINPKYMIKDILK